MRSQDPVKRLVELVSIMLPFDRPQGCIMVADESASTNEQNISCEGLVVGGTVALIAMWFHEDAECNNRDWFRQASNSADQRRD